MEEQRSFINHTAVQPDDVDGLISRSEQSACVTGGPIGQTVLSTEAADTRQQAFKVPNNLNLLR
jgi:hypothetical protein